MKIGYLAPNGTLYECEPYEHLDLAMEIAEDLGKYFGSRLDAENYLLKLGYILIGEHDISGNMGLYDENGRKYTLTEEQKDWLISNYENMSTKHRQAVDKMLDGD